jgi:exosortase/archaeosortase family protein
MKQTYQRASYVIFFIALSLLLVNNILTASPSILDTDPSTYVIVPLLMLLLLAIFSAKEKAIPSVDNTDMAYGIIAFVAFFAALTAAKYYLAPYSASLRTDMLFFPAAILSLLLLLFGRKNLRKFWILLVYPVFASPLILFPIFGLNSAFAGLNTQAVYGIIHPFINGLSYIPPTTISINNSQIGIGEACAGIGALIGIALFLVPIAYFFDGKKKAKACWVASGVVLLLVLNVLRLLSISLVWLFYGLNASALLVHSFIGILIFYIVIVAMVLLLPKYGITFPDLNTGTKKTKQKHKSESMVFGYAAAIILSLFYFYISLNYLGYVIPSPASLESISGLNTSSQGSINLFSGMVGRATALGFNSTFLPINNTSSAIMLTNGTFGKSTPILLLLAPNGNQTTALTAENKAENSSTYLDSFGNKIEIYSFTSNGTRLFVSHTRLFRQITNDSSLGFSMYLIMPAQAANYTPSCGIDLVDSQIFSLLSGHNIDASLAGPYCLTERIFSSAN